MFLKISNDNDDFHLDPMKPKDLQDPFLNWSKSKDQRWLPSSRIPMEVSNLITETIKFPV